MNDNKLQQKLDEIAAQLNKLVDQADEVVIRVVGTMTGLLGGRLAEGQDDTSYHLIIFPEHEDNYVTFPLSSVSAIETDSFGTTIITVTL